MAAAVVCDLHSCPTYDPSSMAIAELSRYRRSGVKHVQVNVGDSDLSLADQITLLASFRSFLKKNRDEYVLVKTVDDIMNASATQKLAISFDIEGALAIGSNFALLDLFYDLGVRWMAIVYNIENQFGGGCHDPVDKGLTPLGRSLLTEMDRAGLIKDCSHAGYRTAREILQQTGKPTIFSHSNALALQEHPRNIPDELMKACAATGGFVGINGIGIFLGNDGASTESLVRHIDYAVQLIGPGHVAIGLDCVFDLENLNARLAAKPAIWPKSSGYRTRAAIAQPEQWPEIVEALLRLGYSEDDVLKIIGGNFLRVAKVVWH